MMLQTQSKNSRLVAWLNEQERPQRLKEAIEKEKHLEFIRHAQEQGYLLSPSVDFLLEQYSSDGGGSRRVEDIVQVQLFNMRLKDVGDIGMCHNLQYCSLPGNYISRFDGLKGCTRLIRLDLHNNQISKLPGSKFWRNFSDLQILYLHNNSIGRLSSLQNLGAMPNLQVLTLFDTPISLKRGYRHHVVNSIFSLKALDFHVISDEEIIEDAKFGSHFSAMDSAFQYHPLLNIDKERNINEERETVPSILQEVSQIQAKHSPVVIIQRYIRGFLGRCQARNMIASRVWAAVSIQRYWRRYRGLEYIPRPATVKKQPLKSLEESQPKEVSDEYINSVSNKSEQSSPCPSNRDTLPGTVVQSKIDFDTYMKNRRPGSVSPAQNRADELQPLDPSLIAKVQHVSRSTPSPTSRQRASILVDLTKLEAAAHFIPIDELYSNQFAPMMPPRVPESSSFIQPQDIEGDTEKLKAEIKRTSTSKKPTTVTVGKLLGPLDSSSLQREVDDTSDDEEPRVKFRISGLKSIFHHGDPTHEILIEKRETGRDIRATHRDVIDSLPRPKPIIRKKQQPSGAQRLYAKIHGSMGLSALKAVEQAYKDREKAEDIAQRVDYVNILREQRELGKERRRSYLEERRLLALQKRDDDTCELAEALRRQVTLRGQELQQAKKIRSQHEQRIQAQNQDKMFATDFGGQHTAISKALLRHDRHIIKGELKRTKERIVKTEREYQKSQSELVQRYLEHRKLMRQAQVAVERAALDSKISQETNNRLFRAQGRVIDHKQRKKKVQAFFPLPKTATDPILPPVVRDGKPDRFETLISMYDGRVGNHPPVFGS